MTKEEKQNITVILASIGTIYLAISLIMTVVVVFKLIQKVI